MLKNYFKSAWRNLLRNRGYALINILGLAMGIACALLIYSIIRYELSFDTYHPEVDRLYRVVSSSYEYGEVQSGAGLPYPAIPAMRNDFPEFEMLTIVDGNFSSPVFTARRSDGELYRFNEDASAYVDPQYFQLFHYDWVSGGKETALQEHNSLVLSQTLAQKLFGDEDPLDKTLLINGESEWRVSGVVKEIPANTDLPFEALLRIPEDRAASDNWGSVSSSVQAYLRLAKNVDPAGLTDRFDAFYEKHRGERGKTKKMRLQPLSDMHFNDNYETFGYSVPGGGIIGFAWIGMALLLMACINFINLSTALAINRSREVGVRKVLGGTRSSLILQFLGETAIVTFLASLFSIALVEISAPYLQNFMDYPESVGLSMDSQLLLPAIVLFLLVTLLAGLYPAFYLSRYQPVEAMRNRVKASYGNGLNLRRGLVILQFAICQALILGTMLMSGQIDFMLNADLGFDKESVVEVHLPSREPATISTLKNRLQNSSVIQHVTMSNSGSASGNTWTSNFHMTLNDEDFEKRTQVKFVDADFLTAYGIQLVAGRDFLSADSTDDMIVNQTFARETGFGDDYAELLGKEVRIWGKRGPVVGVVSDFHTNSFHVEKSPVVIMRNDRYWLMAIKIMPNATTEALKVIEAAWSDAFTEHVFEYAFLDDTIAEFYEEEKSIGQLVNVFTAIAILIGTMGLFGLASYMAAQRTKEIGIRKILGAATIHILGLLSKEYLMLMIIAFVLAAPAAYVFMTIWLEDFVYRVPIRPTLFIGGLLFSLVIAFFTVGYKSFRIAVTNPVESLRSE